MARVGIDLDGVCYDFVGALRNYLSKYCGWSAKPMPDATRWEFYEDWGMARDQFLAYCRSGVEHGCIFWAGRPLAGTYDALQALQDAGHKIVVVTDRKSICEQAVDATEVWLASHRIPVDEIHFLADKTKVELDYMIDDRLENYDALDAAGVKVYLWDRPWNQDDTKERRRVSSWNEFLAGIPAIGDEATFIPPGDLLGSVEHKTNGVRMVPGGMVGTMQDPYSLPVVKLDDVGEVRVTSSTGGQKGQKLARFDLLPQKALWKVAELYGKGAEKYADNNWRQGYDWSLSFAAMQRHASLFWSGEDIDPETKCPHMASVAFHALSLLTFMEEHPEFDNRFKAGE